MEWAFILESAVALGKDVFKLVVRKYPRFLKLRPVPNVLHINEQ